MKLTALVSCLAFATVNAGCTPGEWGTGTCMKILTSKSYGSEHVSPHIMDVLSTCFKKHYGSGPYTLKGLSNPDYGGVGTSWQVYKKINGATYGLSIGNLCSCKQTINADIFNDLHDKASDGKYLTIEQRCAVNNQRFCPAAGAPGGRAPSGVYAAGAYCDSPTCENSGLERNQAC